MASPRPRWLVFGAIGPRAWSSCLACLAYLDIITSRKWKEYINLSKDLPILDTFITFIKGRAELLETVEHTGVKRRHSEPSISKQKTFVTNPHSQFVSFNCPYCKQDHPIYKCFKFKSLAHQAKIQKIKQLNLCINCLRKGHKAQQCRLGSCRVCGRQHNTLLHQDEAQIGTESPLGNKQSESVALSSKQTNKYTTSPEEASESDIVLSSTAKNTCVLLSTALIDVVDCFGAKHTVRALIDNGSTTNFITEKLHNKLRLPSYSTSTTVEGLSRNSLYINKRTIVQLFSCTEHYDKEINCFVVPQITQLLPTVRIDISNLNIPSNIKLADPGFHTPSEIDMLLSAEIFWSVLDSHRIILGKNKPTLHKTKFGWLVSGLVPTQHVNNYNENTVHCHLLNDSHMQNQLDKFFELESVSSRSTTKEENECEQFFIQTTSRQDDGRFVVTIPFRESPSVLGDSYQQAITRFHSLERRFKRDSSFKKKYCEFMQEYLDLGHMSLNNTPYSDKYTYILPHHGILKESNLTTKLRTVFDGSAVTSSGHSLNSIQHVGPVVQEDLFSILIRFRQHKYVVTSDCEKMYRCILVSEDQQCLQQILWRFDPSEPIQLYKLNTVTYGLASAPYLATRCLTQLGHECSDPLVRETILHDFYMDDYISGNDSECQLLEICQGVINQLKRGQFYLRKWRSNNFNILNKIPNDSQDNLSKLVNDENAKTLGLRWSCKSDSLFFSVNIQSYSKIINKRSILSIIGQIFDPLGLLSPCTLQAKLILQKLWASQLSWDEHLPADVKNEWLLFIKSIPLLNEISMPRWVLCDASVRFEIHTFSDASLKSYCACVYVRSTSANGHINVKLLTAKSKVAPLKGMTVPRLELCGALLAVKLANKVKNALRLNIDSWRYWCDSTVVLGWIRTPKSTLKAFVLNRINEITENTDPASWGYVSTNINPADIGSRACNARQLKTNSLWWSGPQFLTLPESYWPTQPNTLNITDLPELKIQCTIATKQNEFINKCSNYSKLQRITSFILRFINNCRFPHKRYTGHLKVPELLAASLTLCKIVQFDKFSKEYTSLKRKELLSGKSPLLNLNPFMTKEGVIRVGGRLSNSNYDYNTKHPIILHSSHHITLLLFRYYHKILMHAGPQLLLSVIRHKYWTIGGRNLARKVTHECVTCCRYSGKTIQPIMSSLPKERLHTSFPFSNVAVDYAGPIMIADKKGRGCRLVKSYICIFVCLAVRAVHIELVTELSTEAFIAVLNRFIARRGKPLNIFSDNGTAFVGTFNELSKFLKANCDDINAYASEQFINFKFSPVYSPHFNGLAEGSVKSVKFHLKRILSLAHLTYKEMNTVLIQIEGILNSRPLTPLSSDPNDLVPLTPSHFLLGRTVNMLPSVHLAENPQNMNTLTRYKRAQVLANHFWQRYYKEYISELQKRVKWKRNDKGELHLGDMVVIKDDRLPPNRWLLGRVIRLYPGADGCTRVFDIQTAVGVLKRAYNRICPLPICNVVEQDVPPGGAC